METDSFYNQPEVDVGGIAFLGTAWLVSLHGCLLVAQHRLNNGVLAHS